MELELAITSYQRLSPTVTSSRTFNSSRQYSLGRSRECDWCLPDPDRVISSRHADVFFDGQQFVIRDTSTNGVFINGAKDPLGKGVEETLRDGDCLRFGDYEFRLRAVVPAAPVRPVATDLNSGQLGISETPHGRPTVPQSMPSSSPGVGDLPVTESMGGNPMLASGLVDQALSDSHVDIPDIAIPTVWKWGEADGRPEDEPLSTAPAGSSLQAALFNGLGMPQLADQLASPDQMHALGDLTRILLDRLLELLHARAEQKQKLRVQQTLFQRTENNPLKFSATAQDAIEALLVRRHGSFLGPQDAVVSAFSDIMSHERALMVGVERVISEILQEPGDSPSGRMPLLRKARMYDSWRRNRAQQREEFGDGARMLRSDLFIEAYESAIREGEQE
ncbi:type VI secretion system-associated FHA domain protein TagH [Marinobacter sp.]|uniref:type VI secretion system-associated FHA domain protein TagH n=1 Tax=Marinobacter sp. TaxID=50741 RepID=UPI00384C021A